MVFLPGSKEKVDDSLVKGVEKAIPATGGVLAKLDNISETLRKMNAQLDASSTPRVSDPPQNSIESLTQQIQFLKGLIQDIQGYDGELVNKLRHGQGTQVYPNKDRYSGHWSNHLRHGYGICVFHDSNQVRYEGEWKNDLPDGQGTCTYRDGTTYVGSWVNGLRHGPGVMTYPDKTVYQGQWLNDEKYKKEN